MKNDMRRLLIEKIIDNYSFYELDELGLDYLNYLREEDGEKKLTLEKFTELATDEELIHIFESQMCQKYREEDFFEDNVLSIATNGDTILIEFNEDVIYNSNADGTVVHLLNNVRDIRDNWAMFYKILKNFIVKNRDKLEEKYGLDIKET